ncbi:NAD(P)-dependent oxidoreductase [Bailinhaonella thermotolerans]|uniref:NAD-dependent epimerase/dehydratase family protein n=1 Tax=Bailinhaonella thermotolerans TaxID=1070861 RepID=A0A3A4AUS6_9ACTN|nr:NAD(P)H-binding protein [Bailinhaonella thermotolerans]RJL33345.1 NAD-dependent epimerase/dehydratase family protein [Bailinhaonella thermotolerans]
MKIVVVGAAGMVGSRVVAEAVRRGHDVVAVCRRAVEGWPEGVIAAEGDAGDRERMGELFAGADAVVQATRPRPGRESGVPALTTAVLDAAAAADVRVLVVGGASVLRGPDDPERLLIDDPRHVPEEWRAFAAASLAQYRACEAHRADWTYLSPAAFLEPGVRTGRYRRGGNVLLTDAEGRSRISAEDLAAAVLDELETPSGTRHITAAY